MALRDLTTALVEPIPPMLNASPNAPIRALQSLLGPTKKRVGNKQNNTPDDRFHTQPKHKQNHNLRRSLRTILQLTIKPATISATTPPISPPRAPRATIGGPAQQTRLQTIYPNDTKIRKQFDNDRWYSGQLAGYDSKENYYKVVYDDGDIEDLTPAEVRAVLVTKQSKPTHPPRAHNLYIPTPKGSTHKQPQHKTPTPSDNCPVTF